MNRNRLLSILSDFKGNHINIDEAADLIDSQFPSPDVVGDMKARIKKLESIVNLLSNGEGLALIEQQYDAELADYLTNR
jgi:hypothetical protein